MVRRKKSSLAEDLVELIAKLPWWAGVTLALLGYLLLHRVAVEPMSIGSQPGQSGVIVRSALVKGLATGGQYILPIICLLAAGLSAWNRSIRSRLVADVAQSQASDVLDGMSWREFEQLVGEGFRLRGYRVVETGGGGADGGVDLVLTRPGKSGGEKFLVQCKQWRALKVGVDVVRELYGVMAARGATGGFVVTSGRFTEDAADFASGRNVTLMDGPQLVALIRQVKNRPGQPTPLAAAPTVERPPSSATAQATVCPMCSRPMVRRTAKRGVNAGAEFWGCTAYPACRGTRPIG